MTNTGSDLIREINESKPPVGGLDLWWLGQQSWVVRTARHVFWLDPYLTPKEKRRTPPLLQPGELTNADYILGSHDHTDHIDRPSLGAMMAASPRARLLTPRLAAQSLPADGVPAQRLVEMDDEAVFADGGVRVTALKAAHEFFDHSEKTGYPYLQYIIEADGVTFYHAGDTLRYDGLLTRLQAWRLDLALVPINGRDGPRLESGCLGNMTWQEAADLIGELQPRLACPAHYDMFANNLQDPEPFAHYMRIKYPQQRIWIGRPGERVPLETQT